MAARPSQRVADRLRSCAAALGDVGLAATAAAERLGGDADQSSGLEPALAGGLVDRGDHHGPVGGDTGDHDDRRSVGRDPAAHVERELAQVVGAGAVRHPVRRPRRRRRTSPAWAASSPAACEHLLGAEPLDLLLGVAQPGDHAGDPLGQLLAAAP